MNAVTGWAIGPLTKNDDAPDTPGRRRVPKITPERSIWGIHGSESGLR
jgi:hypothetical protein